VGDYRGLSLWVSSGRILTPIPLLPQCLHSVVFGEYFKRAGVTSASAHCDFAVSPCLPGCLIFNFSPSALGRSTNFIIANANYVKERSSFFRWRPDPGDLAGSVISSRGGLHHPVDIDDALKLGVFLVAYVVGAGSSSRLLHS